MPVDETIIAGIVCAEMVLVEEKVAQTVVDESILEEFQALGLMSLASADDCRACLR
jgi:hypothetical protein